MDDAHSSGRGYIEDGDTPMAPEITQTVLGYTNFAQICGRWGWYPQYLHRSAIPEGQGCQNRQQGRRPYPPGNVSIQYVVWLSTHRV